MVINSLPSKYQELHHVTYIIEWGGGGGGGNRHFFDVLFVLLPYLDEDISSFFWYGGRPLVSIFNWTPGIQGIYFKM